MSLEVKDFKILPFFLSPFKSRLVLVLKGSLLFPLGLTLENESDFQR